MSKEELKMNSDEKTWAELAGELVRDTVDYMLSVTGACVEA